MEQTARRFKRITVSFGVIETLLKKETINENLISNHIFFDDVKVIRVNDYGHFGDRFDIIIESEQFEPIKEDSLIPSLDLWFTRVEAE